jgi:ribosomal protein L44E
MSLQEVDALLELNGWLGIQGQPAPSTEREDKVRRDVALQFCCTKAIA